MVLFVCVAHTSGAASADVAGRAGRSECEGGSDQAAAAVSGIVGTSLFSPFRAGRRRRHSSNVDPPGLPC